MVNLSRRNMLYLGMALWLALPALRASGAPAIMPGSKPLPPTDPRVQQAKSLLEKAPTTGTPYAVAEYFAKNIPPEFQKAWPVDEPDNPQYANPVIWEFLEQTGISFKGDETAWCAAFVCWCLRRVRVRGPNTASSQAFLQCDWKHSIVWSTESGGDMAEARQGDIVVFTDDDDPTQGHVTFFTEWLDPEHTALAILGGNQRLKGKTHVIGSEDRNVHRDGQYLRAILTCDGLRQA